MAKLCSEAATPGPRGQLALCRLNRYGGYFLYGKNLGVGTFSKYGLAVWSSGVIRRLRTHASPGTQGCGTFVERSWNVCGTFVL